MKNRYLLCLLLCMVMFYFAIPRLSLNASNLEGVFAISWFAFALIVVAGNLSALLFTQSRPHLSKLQKAVNRKAARRVRGR